MKTFLPKISCLLLLFFCIQFQLTHAQIVYTDVSPDSVFSAGGSKVSVDLNKDGIVDFNLSITTKTTSSCSSLGTKTNKYLNVSPADTNNAILNNSNLPGALTFNTSIEASSQFWKNTASQKLAADTFRCVVGSTRFPRGGGGSRPSWINGGSGNFRNTTDKYLAVRFFAGNQLYYGWIRLSVTSNVTVTLQDYAYQSNGKLAIVAGQNSDDHKYIVTSESKVSKLCAGDSTHIGYLISGNFDPSNVVTVEMSDSVGNFSKGTIIGSATRNVTGTIPCRIPSSFSGTGFRFRVKSSNPVQIAPDNGSNLMINNKLPNNSVTPSQAQVVCAGASIALTVPLGNGNTYQWKKDSINIPGSVSRNYSANASGLFSCDITNGCGTVHSNSVSLKVLSTLPEIYITYKGPLNINEGDSVELSCNILDPTLIYRWYRNSVLLNPINSTMTYMAKVSGSYSLKIGYPVYDCSKTTYALNIYVQKPNAVKETYSAQSNLKVQPNPFSTNVLISFSNLEREKFSVSIVDLTGRLVKTITPDVSGNGQFEYNWMADDQNGNSINSGIYFLKLDAETFSQTRKLILVR